MEVIIFGNESQANPPASSFAADYSSFVYHPRLAFDFNGTADPTMPPYFHGQVGLHSPSRASFYLLRRNQRES
jgi:hypothetical protein